ncbi:unnamed protein product [Phytophthora lilii]|uniref:RxLR effector protein n=1 Tax=Phytophthora lilii TaxID=2077276 RepID=A0A9W6THJ7_9STRA|nr:unnamed protein product [Phytophthora lilii]
MRAINVFLATATLLASCTAVSTNAAHAEAPKDDDVVDFKTRRLRSQHLIDLEFPTELEEWVHHHHHIREMFTVWCLEGKEPEDALKEAKGDKRAQKVALIYKKYRELHSGTGTGAGRRLFIAECSL